MDASNFIEVLGIAFTEISGDRIKAEMTAGEIHTNGNGVVHGGVYMSFADTLGARGAIMNLPENCMTSTLESKTNLLRGMNAGKIFGESLPVHVGRTTQVWRTTLTNEAGKKLAEITQTQLVIETKPDHPVTQRQQATKARGGI